MDGEDKKWMEDGSMEVYGWQCRVRFDERGMDGWRRIGRQRGEWMEI